MGRYNIIDYNVRTSVQKVKKTKRPNAGSCPIHLLFSNPRFPAYFVVLCGLLCCVVGLLQDLFHELGKAKGVSSKININF